MRTAVPQASVLVVDTMIEITAFVVSKTDWREILFAAAFFFTGALCRNLLPVKKIGEKVFSRNSVRNH